MRTPTVRLALASLRKAKVQMLVLAGFAALAAGMINLGLVLTTEYPAAFDAQAEAAAVPDVMDLTSPPFDTQRTWLDDHRDVAAVEREPILLVSGAFARHDGVDEQALSVFALYGSTRSLDLPQLRDGAEPLGHDGIYLPYLSRLRAGYEVGDTFSFHGEGATVTFTVRGFTDDVVLGGPVPYRFYVDDVAFASLVDQLSGSVGVYTKIRLDDGAQPDAITTLLTDAFFDQETAGTDLTTCALTWTSDGVRVGRVFMGQILAVLLLVAAAIIALVALVVVWFRVASSIEESMTNIGILKTIGYTSGQVVGSLVGQFCLVAGAGALVGIGASHALLPLVADLLERQSMRPWTPGLAPLPALATIVAVTAATLLVTGAAAARIRRLSPLTAVRSGLAVHSFRRNHLPLAATRGGLLWLLALKSAIQRRGQMVTVGLVVAAVAFMSVVSVALYENIGGRSERFAAVAFGEPVDVAVVAEDPDTAAALQTDLSERGDVRSAFFASESPVRVDDIYADAVVTDDFARTENTMLYRGSYPRYDNEVAIGWTTADALGKGIGDTVRVDDGGQDAEFLITGLTNFGAAFLTTEGLFRIDPQYQHYTIAVYLVDPEQSEELTDQINDWGIPGVLADNRHDAVATQASVYGDIMFVVSLVVLGVTAAAVVLVLVLVLSLAILRGRRGFGIQKAVGFTTRQLVSQVVTTYLPVVGLSTVVGGAAGHLTFPSVIDQVFQVFDAHVTSMHASLAVTAWLVVGIVVFAGVVATLVALKVRQVGPRSLIAE